MQLTADVALARAAGEPLLGAAVASIATAPFSTEKNCTCRVQSAKGTREGRVGRLHTYRLG